MPNCNETKSITLCEFRMLMIVCSGNHWMRLYPTSGEGGGVVPGKEYLAPQRLFFSSFFLSSELRAQIVKSQLGSAESFWRVQG